MGSKVWPKAVVSERLDERSYIVDTDKGSYRRNHVDIKKTQEEQPHIEPSEEPPGTSTEEINRKQACCVRGTKNNQHQDRACCNLK